MIYPLTKGSIVIKAGHLGPALLFMLLCKNRLNHKPPSFLHKELA